MFYKGGFYVLIPKKKKKIIFICSCLFFIISIIALRLHLKVVYYKINNAKIKQPIRLLFLSDLHSSKFGENQKQLLDYINKQNPDIILLGGDIADDRRPYDNTKIVLQSIGKKYPCFYVTGNHEFGSGEVETIKKMFLENNITILEGTAKSISSIFICGVDDRKIGKEQFLNQIEAASAEVSPSFFTVFISHRPEYIDVYKKYNFDLILSGHAHGGQWRIPYLVNGVYAPNQGFFPKYAGGSYVMGDKTFIVGRGLAKWSTPLIPRIFNPPEIVVIDLEP